MAKIFKSMYRDGGSCDFLLQDSDEEIGIQVRGEKGRLIASAKIDDDCRVYYWKATCYVSGESELFKKAKEAYRKCEEYILKSTGIKYLS